MLGFYYLNNADLVRCAFCAGIIGQWEVGDQPHDEHRKFFPTCPMIRQQQHDISPRQNSDEDIGIQPVRWLFNNNFLRHIYS